MRYMLNFMDYGSYITSKTENKTKTNPQTQTQTLNFVTSTYLTHEGQLYDGAYFRLCGYCFKILFIFTLKKTPPLIGDHSSQGPLQTSS